MRYWITAGMYRDGKINLTMYTQHDVRTMSEEKVVFPRDAEEALKKLKLGAKRNGYQEKEGSVSEKELKEMLGLWKKIPKDEKEKYFYTCCAGTVSHDDIVNINKKVVA